MVAWGWFNLSNVLGHGMVLQREPQQAIVWGFGQPGLIIRVTMPGVNMTTSVAAEGIWRQALPPQPASHTPTTIVFHGSDGGQADLRNVLFGDVFLCGGQSNMQYTPRSMAGMNNMSAEIAAADGLGDGIRLFTVGMETRCGDPKTGHTNCSQPFRQLDIRHSRPGSKCQAGHSCRTDWVPASSSAVGAQSWNTFSAVCWLMGRDVFHALCALASPPPCMLIHGYLLLTSRDFNRTVQERGGTNWTDFEQLGWHAYPGASVVLTCDPPTSAFSAEPPILTAR